MSEQVWEMIIVGIEMILEADNLEIFMLKAF